MSYFRAKHRETNRNVLLDNRLSNFTNPPMRTGDLYVERNEWVGGNVDICGNLTVGQDLRARNFYASGNYYLNGYILIPAGSIIQSAAINVPDGWLDCIGQSLTVSVYNNLFNAISYTYGGSGLSFNLPDMRGRVGVGAGDGPGAALSLKTLGATGGEENHTLSIGEMPSHSHSLTRRSNPDDGACDIGNVHQDESSAATTDRDELGLFNTNTNGDGDAHNNMQPFLVLRYFIKY